MNEDWYKASEECEWRRDENEKNANEEMIKNVKKAKGYKMWRMQMKR